MRHNILAFVIGIVGFFSSCAHQSHNESEHDHAHEEIMVPYWGYNNEVEVFLESKPLVVGKVSSLLVHLTTLNDFNPLTPDKITVKYIVGTKGIKQVQEVAKTEGIFSFQLQPVMDGKGYFLFEFEIDGAEQVVRIDNVTTYADAHDAIHLAEENIPHVAGAITYLKEKSWKVEFATEYPLKKPFGRVMKATASVENTPTDRIVVSAKTSGFVNFASGMVTPGMPINGGQLIFMVKGDGISDNNAEVMLKKAKAELELSKAEYERDVLLAEKQIVSNKEMIETRARYEKARTEYNNLVKTIGENGERILAPISGFIDDVYVVNGRFVEAGEQIFTMVGNKRLMLTALVSQSYLKDLRNITDINIEVSDRVLGLDELNGKIISVGQSIRNDHHLLPVVFEIDNQDELVSEGFTNVYLKASQTESLVVPESALTEEQGVFFVYVQITPEQFEKRQITAGASDGMYRAVLSGLKEGERIVTKGAILVKLAAVSNSIDPHAGHVH